MLCLILLFSSCNVFFLKKYIHGFRLKVLSSSLQTLSKIFISLILVKLILLYVFPIVTVLLSTYAFLPRMFLILTVLVILLPHSSLLSSSGLAVFILVLIVSTYTLFLFTIYLLLHLILERSITLL